MCQAACPVKIDTGALMKELKASSHSQAARAIATARPPASRACAG
jgi:hypothetical protein